MEYLIYGIYDQYVCIVTILKIILGYWTPELPSLVVDLRREPANRQQIWSQGKKFFCLSQVRTYMSIQEMQKFWFYLVRFENYGQKTKKGSILGHFSKNFKCELCFFGWIYMIDHFRDVIKLCEIQILSH